MVAGLSRCAGAVGAGGPVVAGLRRGPPRACHRAGADIDRLAERLVGRGTHEPWGVHHLQPQLRTEERVRARHLLHVPATSLDAIVTPTVPWIGPLQTLRAGPRGPRLRVLLSHGGRGTVVPIPARVPVRRHQAALPVVILVDDSRAAVEVEHRGSRTFGWTRDPAQVGLLRRVFDLVWDDAAQPEGTMCP